MLNINVRENSWKIEINRLDKIVIDSRKHVYIHSSIVTLLFIDPRSLSTSIIDNATRKKLKTKRGEDE